MELRGWQKAKYINNAYMFVKLLQHYAIVICTTDANRPEKKDQN